MNELALFAGVGGGLLGTTHLLGWRTVAAVEIDPYRREVLLRRQLDGVLDVFPIWDDCRTFDGNPWRGLVDVVTAGFPCQPFSVAGKRRGADDERNGWPDTIRIIREVRPRYAFLENVPGLLGSGYFGRVLGDLAEAGFDAEWCVLGADDVGAPHRRKRLWILATNPASQRTQSAEQQGQPHRLESNGEQEDVADASQELLNGAGDAGTERRGELTDGGWWDSERGLDRVAHGVAHRIHRLAAIGDGQVPAVVALAWQTLIQKAPAPTERKEGERPDGGEV